MRTITVIGLGAGSIEQIPLGVYRKLTQSNRQIWTRTEDHPVITQLKNEGLSFHSFDSIYESYDSFESVYEEIVGLLIERSHTENIIYTVPGHPLVAEQTVQLLFEQTEVDIEILGGQSFLDSLFTAVQIDPIEGFQLLDGTSLSRDQVQYRQHVLIGQVYDQMVASDVKLILMEDLPHDYPITIVQAAGMDNQSVKTVPLYELDRDFEFSNLTTLYVEPANEEHLHHQFSALREVIATLRGPNGCPWDKKQTHESLRRYLIEESYEVIDAIGEEDDDHIAEELGDVLLQVMLHSQIAEDNGYFTVDDVIQSITDKMIERHPHVFGHLDVESADEVKKNWDEIKQKNRPKQKSLLDDLNESLPRLLLALEIQKKVSKVGFDWDDHRLIFEKVKEEIKEFEVALSNETTDEAEVEFGDVLFSLVNVARFYKLDPELALHRTCDKFIKRFQKVEMMMQEDDLSLEESSLDIMDQYWEKAKQKM
ncbi:nucleoside triphosphate pyrophosphohydrolase [Tenuibacillus multivorans]|uniref:Tetrapyrrole methylase family protein / MazG family protein n=1 Tax=Tenuibacillus multivorans TaxID=237069 RepID=A0A1G9VYV5_9BACI|nr:nucleoside triphosphate pyrophosphohydrolase [Tenuibacillus multivorans]GEL78253.1 MazG family protein [Tenuibacillus multivorans]SDM77479.1 tetrapyrrole methylase family protein / MazG family protein [Tenuibacillus multivorans]